MLPGLLHQCACPRPTPFAGIFLPDLLLHSLLLPPFFLPLQACMYNTLHLGDQRDSTAVCAAQRTVPLWVHTSTTGIQICK